MYNGGAYSWDIGKADANSTYLSSKRNSQDKYFFYDTSSVIGFFNLEESYTTTITYSGNEVGTITYSVLDYIKVVQEKQSNKTDLNNYLKAMYALYSACKAV